MTTTTSPSFTAASTTRPRQAVTPAVVMVAASAWLQPSGALVKAEAAATTVSRAKPSTPSPGTVAKPTGTGVPSVHPGKNSDTTRSPTASEVTPSPTASTTPAPSDMGMRPPAVGPDTTR